MLFSLFPLQSPGPSLDDVEQRREQFGGGGSIEEQCSSITFEDMFLYDQANFDIRVDEGWQTAQVEAKAWINWTLADDIREDLDAYLEGIVPSGGDGWLSTDEIGAVILIAADCLQHSLTRIGIRDGAAHRGGVGVDWKNTTWKDQGMEIAEYNGIPPRHLEKRECQGFNQGDCYEIPVIPATGRDCDTEVNESFGADECRVVLWLNATLEIDGLTDPNDFTIAFNSSNMSNARLDFTFPQMPDLRLDIWEECEGRYVGPDEDNPGGGSTMPRGSCFGDESSSHELLVHEDGRLTYTLFPSLERAAWPYGEDIFADFTTSPVPIDTPPKWTEEAPEDGTWFPVAEEGQTKWVSWAQLSSWFSDESGASSLEIECMTSDKGQISQSIDRSLWVTVEGLVEVSCHSIDSSGQSSGNRSWSFGVPVSIGTPELSLSDPHPIVLQVSQGWSNVSVEIGLVREGLPRSVEKILLDPQTMVDQCEGDDWCQVVYVPSSEMLPGPVLVWVRAYHTEGNYMEHLYDLGITKQGSRPLVILNSGEWQDDLWKITGQYSDPDGESVTFTISVEGEELVDGIHVQGNTWESQWIDLKDFEPGETSVTVIGCDQSNMCVSEKVLVNTTFLFEQVEHLESEGDEKGGSIPAVGAFYAMASVFAALMYLRRPDR